MRGNALEFPRPSAWLTAALLLSTAATGRAAPRADVSVACPELTSETRSSLEARARAEIALKDLRAGHIQIECGPGRVRVAFEKSNGEVLERELALSGGPPTWVEPILALVHELTSAADSPPKQSAEAFPADAAPAATPTEPPPPPPAPIAPPRATVPAPPTATSASNPTSRTETATRGRSAGEVGFEPGAGVCTELWTNEPVLLFGPCFSLGFRVGRVRVAPGLGLAWASSKIEGMSLSTTTAGLEAAYGERWWIGGGVQTTWSHLEAPAELSPDAEMIVEPALTVKGGYTLAVSVHRVVIALGLRASARYHDVRVDQTPVFRVPALAPLAAAEYRLAF
jgi:hypothetical protein